MTTGKLIRDVSIGRLRGSMKIPVGGSGNMAITPELLKRRYKEFQNIYVTTNPNINANNGLAQDLILQSNGTLTLTGGFVFVRVHSGYNLNISGFNNANGYTRDNTKDSILVLIKSADGSDIIFGYDYKEGTGGGTNNPVISCADATASISFSSIHGVYRLFIDDLNVPYMIEDIGQMMSHILSDFPDIFTGDYDGFWYIQNIDSEDHKFKLVPVGVTDHLINEDEANPSFMEGSDGTLYFCLKGTSDQQVISCDGATDYVYFTHIYDYWDVYLDGVKIYSSIAAPDLVNQLEADYPLVFKGDYDTYMTLQNMSDTPHRFRMVPIDSTENTTYYDPESNPTLGVEIGGSIHFCLSAKSIQSHASFDLYASWASMGSTGLPKYFRIFNATNDDLLFEYDMGTDINLGIADLVAVADAINNASIGLQASYSVDDSVFDLAFSNVDPSPIRNFTVEIQVGNEYALGVHGSTVAQVFIGETISDPSTLIFEMKPQDNLPPVPM